MQSFNSFGDWDLVGFLGEGGFGNVHMFRHRISGQEIATKSLKPNPKLREDEIQILKKRWIQEFKWMQELKIPYIVGAISLADSDFLRYLQDQNHWKTLPVIVMEYCNGGDLRSRLEKIEHVNGLSEKEVRDILRTLRYAVEYLHRECNIEHRDIKPENIVIHHSDNTSIYKLTDFGYAREIPENTIAQSVVGTRHYVAPEVIEPGSYTKTVDYWSIGVMTFEIICGVRPFIPHRDFRLILTNILVKPKKCIAITQTIEDSPNDDRFLFKENIFRQNMCSPIFIKRVEKWLGLALDGDYKTRGSNDGKFKLYSDLDDILKTNIVTVFSLTSYQFYYYDINAFRNLVEFFEELSSDTNIDKQKIFLTLPTSHPKKTPNNIKIPQDFFVSEWMDNSNPDNPATMLYVADTTMKQCNFNERYKNVSETIRKCLEIDQKHYDKVPIWLLEQFERHVHYLLSNEQRHLECYVKGLYEYIISIEDEVFRYEPNINKVYEDSLILSGRVQQLAFIVRAYASMQGHQNHRSTESWLGKAEIFIKECNTLKDNVVSTITKRYKSVLRHCKEIASRDIYKIITEEDIYKLKDFRRVLDEAHMTNSRNMTNAQRMNVCVLAFDGWTRKLTNFPPQNLVGTHQDIALQLNIYLKIRENVMDFEIYKQDFSRKLETETTNLLSTICPLNQLSLDMNTLCIDGNSQSLSLSTPSSSTLMNGDCHKNDGEITVNQLIEEAHNLQHSIKSIWAMDVDNLPTTINDIS